LVGSVYTVLLWAVLVAYHLAPIIVFFFFEPPIVRNVNRVIGFLFLCLVVWAYPLLSVWNTYFAERRARLAAQSKEQNIPRFCLAVACAVAPWATIAAMWWHPPLFVFVIVGILTWALYIYLFEPLLRGFGIGRSYKKREATITASENAGSTK
jgi:O-antigen/teichoic acid export membrane protein